jgi:hypothetical protein
MATVLKKEEGSQKQGEMVPVRSAFPLLPDLVERFGEILDESLLRWPLRWPETSLQKDLVRISSGSR